MPQRTVVFAVGVVIGLLVGFGATYLYSAGQTSSLQSSLSSATESLAMLREEMQNTTTTLALSPQPGQMFHSGWLFIAPLGKGHYAVFIHAEGLEPPSLGGYIVEGVTKGGSMNMVPLGPNATASEFEAGANGVSNFWIILGQNPMTNYEGVDLIYLPGMQMSNAILVASAQLG